MMIERMMGQKEMKRIQKRAEALRMKHGAPGTLMR
jgi:hypothetical protein